MFENQLVSFVSHSVTNDDIKTAGCLIRAFNGCLSSKDRNGRIIGLIERVKPNIILSAVRVNTLLELDCQDKACLARIQHSSNIRIDDQQADCS